MVSEVLDNAEDIIKKIMASGKVEEPELHTQIKDKQEEYGGLLTEAGAAYSVAKDMGIDLGIKEDERVAMPIADIKPDLEGVDIVGTVTQVFPVREWKKETRSGKVGNIIVRDKSGEIRVALWNNDCDLIENGALQRGTQVTVQNASSRQRNDITELSIGGRGRVIIKPGVAEDSTIMLEAIEEGMNDVSAYARIVRVFPITEFERENGKGRVAAMIVTDGTERRLALWDDNTKWATRAHDGDVIKVEGAYVKKNRDNLELNLGWRGRLILNPESAPELPDTRPKSERVSIRELKAGDTYKELRATVVRVFPPTEFEVCSKCGAKASGTHCDAPTKMTLILNAEIDDGTDIIRATFFRDLAERFIGATGEEYDASKFKEEEFTGKEMLFRGQAKENEAYGRKEFVVRDFADVNVEKEIEMLKTVN